MSRLEREQPAEDDAKYGSDPVYKPSGESIAEAFDDIEEAEREPKLPKYETVYEKTFKEGVTDARAERVEELFLRPVAQEDLKKIELLARSPQSESRVKVPGAPVEAIFSKEGNEAVERILEELKPIKAPESNIQDQDRWDDEVFGEKVLEGAKRAERAAVREEAAVEAERSGESDEGATPDTVGPGKPLKGLVREARIKIMEGSEAEREEGVQRLKDIQVFTARLLRTCGPKNEDEWFGQGEFTNEKYRTSYLPEMTRLAERLALEVEMVRFEAGIGSEEEQMQRSVKLEEQVEKYLQNADLAEGWQYKLETFLENMRQEEAEAGVEAVEESEQEDLKEEKAPEANEPEVRVNLSERALERQRERLGEGDIYDGLDQGERLAPYRQRIDDIYRLSMDQRGGYDEGLIDHLRGVGEKVCTAKEPILDRDRRLGRSDRRFEKQALNRFLDTLPSQMKRAMDVGRKDTRGGLFRKASLLAGYFGSHFDVFGWKGLSKAVFQPTAAKRDMLAIRERVMETMSAAAKSVRAEGDSKEQQRTAKDLQNFLQVHAEELKLCNRVEENETYPLYRVDLREEGGVVEVRAKDERQAQKRLEREWLQQSEELYGDIGEPEEEAGFPYAIEKVDESGGRQEVPTMEDAVAEVEEGPEFEQVYKVDATTTQGDLLEGVEVAAGSAEEAKRRVQKRKGVRNVRSVRESGEYEEVQRRSWGAFFRSLFRIGQK